MQKYAVITSSLDEYRDLIGDFQSELNELRSGLYLGPAMDVDTVLMKDGILQHLRIPWGYRDFHPHREWFIDRKVLMNGSTSRGFGEDFEKRRCVVLADLMVMSRVMMGKPNVDYRFQLKSGLPMVFPAIIGSHGGLALIGDYPGTQADYEFGPGLPIVLKGTIAIQRYLDPGTAVQVAWETMGRFEPELYLIEKMYEPAFA